MTSQPRDGIVLQEIYHRQSSGYKEPGLVTTQRRHAPRENDRPLQEFSLPGVDGGKYAWLFLAGSFTIEALVWGKLYHFYPAPTESSIAVYFEVLCLTFDRVSRLLMARFSS